LTREKTAMRIEVDKELSKLLDEIKSKELTISGRGHVETVRFLANYYAQHKPLQELRNQVYMETLKFLNDLDSSLEQSLERVLGKAMANIASRILMGKETLEKTVNSHLRAVARSPGSHFEDAEETLRAGPGPGSAARGRRRTTTEETEKEGEES